MSILKPMFTEESDIHLCINCDAEYSVNLVSKDDDYDAVFCPFCGSHYEEDDVEEDFEEDE